MPRKRTEWPSSAERKLGVLVRKGLTAAEIASQLTADGVPGASVATVGRRMRELRGVVRATKLVPKPGTSAATTKSPAPSTVEAALADVPADPEELASAPIALLDDYINKLNVLWPIAEAAGNMGAMLAIPARIRDLVEAKRKGAPPTPPDPNANPDMIKLAQEVAERLHKMVDLVSE